MPIRVDDGMIMKISGQDFEAERYNLEGLRLDQGELVGQGKLGSDLMFLLPLAYGQIKYTTTKC